MKPPVEVLEGRIVDVAPNGKLTIEAFYDDWQTLTRREYENVEIRLIDGRKLSRSQQNACHKLIREIANATGGGMDATKEVMKYRFQTEELGDIDGNTFSLADAPMSLVCAFQQYLIDFILSWDIPCSFPLLDFVDDVESYLYSCLRAKKCCICGKPTQLHHVETVGAGRNRKKIEHEGMRALPLCGGRHHPEAHRIGQKSFERKYHIPGGVVLDKVLCEVYGVKSKEEIENAQ